MFKKILLLNEFLLNRNLFYYKGTILCECCCKYLNTDFNRINLLHFEAVYKPYFK